MVSPVLMYNFPKFTRRIRANPVWYAELSVHECLLSASKFGTKFWQEHKQRAEIQKTSEFIRTELHDNDKLDEFVEFTKNRLMDWQLK